MVSLATPRLTWFIKSDPTNEYNPPYYSELQNFKPKISTGEFMSQQFPRVLITGCTGFLGRQVTNEFLSRGYFVRGTTRSQAETFESIKSDFERDIRNYFNSVGFTEARGSLTPSTLGTCSTRGTLV